LKMRNEYSVHLLLVYLQNNLFTGVC
jgi:hypothetical protein